MKTIAQRKVDLGLLRILSMLGIIGLHVIGVGGIIDHLSMNSIQFYIILFVYAICFLSVDIFGILSGFLFWNKKTVCRINLYWNFFILLSLLLFFIFLISIIFEVWESL